MNTLVDPVSDLVIPERWLRKTGLPVDELRRRIESGLWMVTASGILLRRGLSTGTVAAAVAKAAVMSLQMPVSNVEVLTPVRLRVSVSVAAEGGRASASKPKSDYPRDVTEGVVLEANAENAEETQLRAGKGIGIARKDGLRIARGAPAINPEARWSIDNAIREAVRSGGLNGALVELSAVNGEEVAKKTLNEQVGIYGGISILGTTGFVEPWNESLVESAEDLIDHSQRVVLTTGRTGLRFAKMHFPTHTPILAGSSIDRLFERARGKETIIVGLPALILKWGNPDILKGTDATTVGQLFDRDPQGKEATAALNDLKARTKAKIVIINREGRAVRTL
jgi:cobalt-precorrin-5B (C1)-methyltransferase